MKHLVPVTLLCLYALCTGLVAKPYLLLDPSNKVNSQLKADIKAKQAEFLSKYNSSLSYSFNTDQGMSYETRQQWENHVKAQEKERFHVLVQCYVGSEFNVVIFKENAPSLKNIDQIDEELSGMQTELNAESELSDLINLSFELTNEFFSYYKSHTKLEEENAAAEDRSDKEKQYALYKKYIKYGAFILLPILALLIILKILKHYENRKPHHFPTPKTRARLGAPHGATSITQIKK